MMNASFMEDEMLILMIYQAESKEESLKMMEEALFELEQDPVMADLLRDTINKLCQLTDNEYLQMDLSDYDQQLEAIISEVDDEGL